MQQDDAMIEQAAIDWIVRLQDPDFEDWDGFETWLSADPAHAQTYHALATAEADVAAVLAAAPAPTSVPLPFAQPAIRRVSRRAWIGGALAASLVAAISVGTFMTRADPYAVETAPGMRRTLALQDGSTITLNGGTRLMLDRRNERIATLERGEAMFVVKHSDDQPFAVRVGDAELVDIGTAFNVTRDGGVTQVAVSEGAVIYNPETEAVRLDAGRRLRAVDGRSTVETANIEPEAVASWRAGRLVYAGLPLSDVAADLARYYGQPVSVAPAIADRPFHGVVVLVEKPDLRTYAPVLDVRVERRGTGWALLPAS